MEKWKSKIGNKEVIVGVLGLGYVGLPLAREFTSAGLKVIGFDIDEKKVKTLNSGRSIIKHVPHAQVKQIRRAAQDRLGELAGVDVGEGELEGELEGEE